jgi:protocadherin alpha
LANTDENVEIDLKMLCECDCEKPENSFPNSENCSNAGTFACGICSKCNGKRTGNTCYCDPEKPINASDLKSHCKKRGIFWLNISKNL